jgi:hypothetical protein
VTFFDLWPEVYLAMQGGIYWRAVKKREKGSAVFVGGKARPN